MNAREYAVLRYLKFNDGVLPDAAIPDSSEEAWIRAIANLRSKGLVARTEVVGIGSYTYLTNAGIDLVNGLTKPQQ